MVETYATAAEYEAYFTDRGIAVPDDDTEINAALLVASEWIDARYRSSFPGTKTGLRAQIREWPRVNAFDIYSYLIGSMIIPTELKAATFEAARRELASAGSLSKDLVPNKYDRVSIDGALSVSYAKNTSVSDVQTQFAIIGELLAPILTGSGAVSSLSGASVRV